MCGVSCGAKMTTWTSTDTFTFIELYQNESCIWNPKHKNHKDITKVNDAWIRISDALGIPVANLKKKKETLMSAFRLNNKKVIQSRKSGAGEDEIFKPIWIYYDAIAAFMSDVYKCKSILNTEVHEDDSSTQEVPLPDFEEVPLPDSEEMPIAHSSCANANQVRENDDITPIRRRSSKPPELAKISTQITNTLSTINNVLNRKTKEIPEDDCDLYGRLLAKKLRQFTESDRQDIMYEIDGMLINKKRMAATIKRQYVASPS